MRVMTTRPLAVPWRPVFVVGWLGLNVGLLFLPVIIALLFMPHDWLLYQWVPDRVASGTLYDPNGSGGLIFQMAPLAGWIMALIVPLGYSLWWALHLAVLPLLRDWKLIALTVFSVPFWIDTMIASTVVWMFVPGVIALRGSKWGAIAYFALFLLMPRPVHLPLAAWLLWKRPDVRVPFALLAGVVAVTTLASGYTLGWLNNLLWLGVSQYTADHNFSPTRLIGPLWFVIGVPLAAWLTWKGRVGLAGLALTPYLLPPYLLMLLWELPDSRVGATPPTAP